MELDCYKNIQPKINNYFFTHKTSPLYQKQAGQLLSQKVKSLSSTNFKLLKMNFFSAHYPAKYMWKLEYYFFPCNLMTRSQTVFRKALISLNAVLSPIAHSRAVASVPGVDSCPAQLKSLPVKLSFSSVFYLPEYKYFPFRTVQIKPVILPPMLLIYFIRGSRNCARLKFMVFESHLQYFDRCS